MRAAFKLPGSTSALALLAALSAGPALAQAPGPVQAVVDEIAQSMITRGQASGVAVAVLMPGSAPQIFTYGEAVAAANGEPARPFRRNTLFEIGSVTKVFTTNLLGQFVREGRLSLDAPLGSFGDVLGPLQPLTATATLRQVADFTAGFPDLAPFCGNAPFPGCLPNERPPISQYGAGKFAAFFRGAVPQNQQVQPPQPVTALPAPYFYSDYSIGLLGLLLGAPEGRRLNNAALERWADLVATRITGPLKMKSTTLSPPAWAAPRVAAGYGRALAGAVVNGGEITAATLVSGGQGYLAPPAVTITGPGSGAAATATVKDGRVEAVQITAKGSGYLAPAEITIAGGTSPATAHALIENGQVTAVLVAEPGAGYTGAPVITITGGRPAGVGRDATLSARVVNGGIAAISVLDGGAGYLEPTQILIAPGAGLSSVVPIWAPAGALQSTIGDMATFTAAALGRSQIGRIAVPSLLSAGFRISQRPSACAGATPALATCPAWTPRSALAWAVEPADPAAGVPAVVSKNGGLPGFSTQVMLMPARDFGVVVFVNAEQNALATGKPVAPSVTVARNVLFTLFYRCIAAATGCS